MLKNFVILASSSVLGALIFATPSAALTMKECSAKYKAAQADGSAKDMKWNDFRKAQCGTDAAAGAPADSSTAAAAATDPEIAKTPSTEPAKPTMTAPAGVTFPSAISSKYASEKPAKARMHTCVDSYKENKAANTLSGLKWIQKGGGYYSLCNAKLKS
ncbi:hypothetical protein [Oryzifoliimicrobium ureilyticus]|uniref:hypothetical protein n=1 Tax=Oryzifoliimicrobium ureilyticus TaxID=3113724 RepID=UPI0030761A5C